MAIAKCLASGALADGDSRSVQLDLNLQLLSIWFCFIKHGMVIAIESNIRITGALRISRMDRCLESQLSLALDFQLFS